MADQDLPQWPVSTLEPSWHHVCMRGPPVTVENARSKIVVLCTAKSEPLAGRIVEDLRASYYSKNAISVLLADKSSNGGPRWACAVETDVAGGLLGGALRWLGGAGTLAIPGAGHFIAAGTFMTTLAGTVVRGLAGALVGMGLGDDEARHYEGKVLSGHFLIAMHTRDPEEARFAREIFKHQGADDISSMEGPAAPRVQAPGFLRWKGWSNWPR